MNKKYCDICNKEIKESVQEYTIEISMKASYYTDKEKEFNYVDVCDDCQESMRNLIHTIRIGLK
jgi:hypothetical protein